MRKLAVMGPTCRSLACTLALALVLASRGEHARARPRAAASPGAHALVGARVITSPGKEVARATILLRNGLVEAVGEDLAVPADARTWDCTGLVVWPGLIDAHVGLDRLNGKTKEPGKDSPVPVEAKGDGLARSAAGHENALVHPETRAVDLLAPDAKVLDALRGQGFTTALVVPDHGILRGRGVVVNLATGAPGAMAVRQVADVLAAFERMPGDSGVYPDSLMGATAVLRQSLLDAQWHRDAEHARARRSDLPRPEEDRALDSLAELLPTRRGGPSNGRLAFVCSDVLDALRAGEVAREFGLPLRLVGSGDEYRRLAELRALDAPIVLPLDFPAAPRAVEEDEWLDVPLEELRHWDRAPDNPRFLHEAGIDVSLSAAGLDDVAAFTGRLRRSIARGLDADVALAMLTTHPARLLGLESSTGTIAPGRVANLVVSRGRPFAKDTEIRDVWIDGQRHVVSRDPRPPLGPWQVRLAAKDGATVRGRLKLASDGGGFSWTPATTGEGTPPEAAGRPKPSRATVSKVEVARDGVTFELEGKVVGLLEAIPMRARLVEGRLSGSSTDGSLALEGERSWEPEPPAPPGDDEPVRTLPSPPGPLTARADVLLRGGRVWTCGPQGILDAADVLVRGGKITAVGRGLVAPAGVGVVDVSGRQVTPGLIDAHSHCAIVGGVNEGTNSCTAEVRIGDVVNSETVAIYRQLAGGLTTANLLHGSANCMGGQSQVIKLRWGAPPSRLKLEGATPAIKFALGENVKQSNWGEKFTTRFPQTRMGVEQFMRQKFLEASSHRDAMRAWKAGKARGVLPPRRDLQLEALIEILEGHRSVHCHSYRQDEILMLMRVAEEMGFRVGTFQHVLEGYKVAEEMARHGAMGSSFTDWWGYKFEVYDAIPFNPALMHERGVVVSVNSDSTELARRMYLEAAKVVKWGGLPAEEALKMVTMHPARQLGVADRVGSIEAGKDADLVVWSASPLSTSTMALKTYVDGLLYFDREQDVAGRAAVEQERLALIERVKASRDDTDAPSGKDWKPSYLDGDGADCMDDVAWSDAALEDRP